MIVDVVLPDGRTFQLAFCAYIFAFSRIGWVYYADTMNRYVPMVAIIISTSGLWSIGETGVCARR